VNALHSLQASRLSPLLVLSHSFIAGTVKFIGANMECCRRRRYELEESSVEESSSDSDSEHDRRCRSLDFYVSVYRTAYSYSLLIGHSHSVAVIIVKCELYSSAIINNKDACNCIMSTKQRRLENLWTTSKVEYAPEQTFVSLLLLWWFLMRSRSAVPYGAYLYYSAHPIVLFLFRFVSIAYGHCDAIIVDISVCLSVCLLKAHTAGCYPAGRTDAVSTDHHGSCPPGTAASSATTTVHRSTTTRRSVHGE